MIQLDLDDQERETLGTVLKSYLSDLRMEIADTDRQDFRDMLKERKAVIGKVLTALGQPVENLPDDGNGLPELGHPHAVPAVAVAGLVHRHVEPELVVRRVGFGAADVEPHARPAQQRPGDADVFRQLA